MPRPLPENWQTLNVARDLGLKGAYPQDLRLKRVARTKNLAAQFLPPIEDDPRPNGGRSKGGKRLAISASMGTDDPWEAGKRAIAWVQEKQRENRQAITSIQVERGYLLEDYWEKWFGRESIKIRSNPGKWRERRLLWEGDVYGIKNQSWVGKPLDQITAGDMEDFWAVLDERKDLSKGITMSGQKEQLRALLNHLYKEARRSSPERYSSLRLLEFPAVSRQKIAPTHIPKKSWDILMKNLVDLSDGAVLKDLTRDQYEALPWTPRNKKNIRNWVDLYDALQFQWYYYLRAEDMPRLRSEWFREEDESINCFLEKTKGDREKKLTKAFRPQHYSTIKRILRRRPSGYLILPWVTRQQNREAESNCLETLNALLRHAVSLCLPEFDLGMKPWTCIRHTSLRLVLEEVPVLGTDRWINQFADNAHTSAKMLRDTYLRFIDTDRLIREVKDQFVPSEWQMIKRVRPH